MSYKGQKLFFDFYLPAVSLYVEVQGIQHTEFNRHFHNDAADFKGQKKRDGLKREWCELNDNTLLCVNYDEVPISVGDLLTKIEEAQNDG